jgi:ATP-dependent DNA helicase RecQ
MSSVEASRTELGAPAQGVIPAITSWRRHQTLTNGGGYPAVEVDDLTRHLETMLGPEAEFRAGQREAIEAVIEDGRRALVVQRTGWGKSLVYWIATRVRRDRGHGPTLIISPLLALMRNQIAAAGRLGLRAETINSSNVEDWGAIHERLTDDAIDVLLISPERLANERFLSVVLPSIQGSIGLLVVDEAHCISDWGHDFRPDYRRIGRILRALDPRVPVLATTATANDRVVADVAEQLGHDATVFRGPLTRRSLVLDTIVLANQAERLAWLAEQIPRMAGSGIVYCLTVADSQRVATFLRSRGIDARPYNADLSPAERQDLEDALIGNRLKALVATVALGMGFDKPDLGFVLHYQRPGSAIAYYQQVGRAGRAVDHAHGVVLSGREDDEIAEYFMDIAFPPVESMGAILLALEDADSLSVPALERAVNLRRGRLAQALKILELDGAVAREGGRYRRTPNTWRPDTERVERVIAQRRVELEQMQAYMTEPGCLMEYLTRLLDDPDPRLCGRCANCDPGRRLPRSVGSEDVQAAVSMLRRDLRTIKPRLKWADGAIAGLSGRIAPPNERGLALCVYGDAGYGRDVQRGKYVDGRFSSELVQASAKAIRERWHPEPAPTWVTALPSTAQHGLVDRFARSLADQLGLPYVDALTVRHDGRPQKIMQNSAQQSRNAYEKLGIRGEAVVPGPVLLVDDIVDSGWTLTVAGWLLRQHGSGPVHPFALAVASARDD